MQLKQFYSFLSNVVTWRNGGVPENGHGLFYLPSHAVLKSLPDDLNQQKFLRTLLVELEIIFGTVNSILPLGGLSAQELVSLMLDKFSTTQHVLFEGYAIDSMKEGLALHNKVHQELEAQGIQVIRSKVDAVNQWNNKTHSKRWFKETFGDASTPLAVLLESTVVSVKMVMSAIEACATPTIILKRNGGGGFGNLILQKEDFDSQTLEAFIQKALDDDSWITVEEWTEWNISGVCSCFIYPEGQIEPVAVVDQILSPATAGFIGSKFTSLSAADQEFLFGYLRQMGVQWYADGLRGFAGYDFIILKEPHNYKGLLLPSGKRFMFIEVTPRVGGHNQELRFLNRLEQKWERLLVHFRAGTIHFGSRTEAINRIGEILQLPYLTEPKARELGYGFFLDGHGPIPTIYDAVVVVGLEQKVLLERLSNLYSSGVIR